MRITIHLAQPESPNSAIRLCLESVKGFEAFSEAFQHGKRFAYRGITGFVIFRSAETTPESATSKSPTEHITTGFAARSTIRFGVTAKKRTRPAVLRNHIKRLLRESLRIAFTSRPEAFTAIQTITLVCNIIPERPQLLALKTVLPSVERIVKDALHYYQRTVRASLVEETPQPKVPEH